MDRKVGLGLVALAFALAAAGCGQGGDDNVMAPQANAIEPVDVNAALGPEPGVTTVDSNDVGNDAAANDSVATDGATANEATENSVQPD